MRVSTIGNVQELNSLVCVDLVCAHVKKDTCSLTTTATTVNKLCSIEYCSFIDALPNVNYIYMKY